MLKQTCSDAEEWRDLLRSLLSDNKSCFIVIGAIDECIRAEQEILLKVHQNNMNSSLVRVKVFLAFRLEIVKEVERT